MARGRCLRSAINNERTSRPSTKRKSREAHLKKERERQKALREARKQNPRVYKTFKAKDRERKKQAKENGKLPRREDMSSRDLRKNRTKMRNYMREYRDRKKAEALLDNPVEVSTNIAEDCDDYNTSNVTPSGPKGAETKQMKAGRKRLRRERTAMYRKNVKLQKENIKLKRKLWKLEKRVVRSKKSVSSPSPKSKLAKVVKGKYVDQSVSRELFAGIVLQQEAKQAALNVGKKFTLKKDVFSRVFTGKIVKKYKLLGQFKKLFSRAAQQARKKDPQNESRLGKKQKRNTSVKIQSKIESFFMRDDVTHESPGKKNVV